MEVNEGKGKKQNLIVKTWERCKSIGSQKKPTTVTETASQADTREMQRRPMIAPEGCFTVYVGPQRQRFVIQTEYANHPLFRVLLDEAESEFGFTSDGPLILPCDVVFFRDFLAAMEDHRREDDEDGEGEIIRRLGCGGGRVFAGGGCSGYGLLSPCKVGTTDQLGRKLTT